MNKLPAAHIDALVATLTFKFSRIEDSNTTVCAALLPGDFRVGLGDSACINPENFDFETGKKYSKERAIENATNNLWQLEGYVLKTTGNLSEVLKP